MTEANKLTFPDPVRTFNDPVTGVRLHQLTDGPVPGAHCYFTRSCWLCDGRWMILFSYLDGAINIDAIGPDGRRRQVTHLPPPPEPQLILQHMHRRFYNWELDRLQMRIPALHPTLPLLVYPWQNELHLVDLETGKDELLLYVPRSESEMPFTAMHVNFTADGKHLIYTTNRRKAEGEPRVDPPEIQWSSALRDESSIRSKIWRYDFIHRKVDGVIHECDGEHFHLLTCPWDADLMLWHNAMHKMIYTMRRDGSELRAICPGQSGHYNWDTYHRQLTTLMSDESWFTHHCSLNIETGNLHRYKSLAGKYQWHQTASPDGKWIATDAPGALIGGKNGIHLIDPRADKALPLCQIDCSWVLHDPQGNVMKSEYLHPNPSWSPDGRYVIFESDFGKGVMNTQVYMADTLTLRIG